MSVEMITAPLQHALDGVALSTQPEQTDEPAEAAYPVGHAVQTVALAELEKVSAGQAVQLVALAALE
jgi:hypothetical protein